MAEPSTEQTKRAIDACVEKAVESRRRQGQNVNAEQVRREYVQSAERNDRRRSEKRRAGG